MPWPSPRRSKVSRKPCPTCRDQEAEEMEKLLDVIEMYQCKGETFDRSAHGFVFSNPQVSAGIRARNRESLVEKAYHYRGQSPD